MLGQDRRSPALDPRQLLRAVGLGLRDLGLRVRLVSVGLVVVGLVRGWGEFDARRHLT